MSKMIQGIAEQFGAALKMIEDIITECPDSLWEDYNQEIIISQVVYHIISSTDWFLLRTTQERDSYIDKYGPDDNGFHDPNLKLTKNQLIDFLEEVKTKATKRFKELNADELNDDPIFNWHGTSVMGSLLYNLRHLMLHVGALHVRINAVNKKDPLRWVSKIYGDERDIRDEKNQQGQKYLKEGNYVEAEKIFLELSKDSEDPLGYYNLACCYSIQDKKEKALEAMKTCVKLDKDGKLKEYAKKDVDFENIREDSRFNELLS